MSDNDNGAQLTASRGPLRAYVGSVGVAAVVILVIAFQVGGPPTSWGGVLVLSALAMLSWVLRERDVGAGVNFSFTSIVLLGAAAIVDPFSAGLVGLSSTLAQGRGQSLIARFFNASMATLLGAVGALTYRLVGGATEIGQLTSPGEIIVHVGLPLMVADLVHCVVNAALVAGAIQASRAGSFRPQLARMLTTTGPAYVGYGVIGFLFAVLWIPAGVGWFSAFLILAPLFVARWAYVQYGEEQRAHENTLSALVSALELKHPGAARHSSRVAQLSEWTAENLGLRSRDIQDVRTAGMLHDLGLIGVPTRVLRTSTPSADDAATVRGHPIAGVAMLQGIAFLHGALPAVRHHHERVDGHGYPDGLQDEQIPLGARIIAAADAFDALTTEGAETTALAVPDALSALRGLAGTHLDGWVVDALERSVLRHGWSPITSDGAESADVGWDHDHPVHAGLFGASAHPRSARSSPKEVGR